ncbi:MAG: hypothetical protein ACQERC_05165 [Bacteroidota bacterium]
MLKTTILLLNIGLLFTASCGKEEVDWSKESDVEIQLASNFEDGAKKNGRVLNVQSANLLVSAIRISGKTLQGEVVDVQYDEPFNADLMNDESSEAMLNIPIGSYEELNFSFQFGQAENENELIGEISKENGQPQSKSLNMNVEAPESIEVDVLKELSKDLLTIEESGGQLSVSFDLEETMDAVQPSLWNGIWTTSEAQNNVDLSTLTGKSFVDEFSLNLFKSVKVTFEN